MDQKEEKGKMPFWMQSSWFLLHSLSVAAKFHFPCLIQRFRNYTQKNVLQDFLSYQVTEKAVLTVMLPKKKKTTNNPEISCKAGHCLKQQRSCFCLHNLMKEGKLPFMVEKKKQHEDTMHNAFTVSELPLMDRKNTSNSV